MITVYIDLLAIFGMNCIIFSDVLAQAFIINLTDNGNTTILIDRRTSELIMSATFNIKGRTFLVTFTVSIKFFQNEVSSGFNGAP